MRGFGFAVAMIGKARLFQHGYAVLRFICLRSLTGGLNRMRYAVEMGSSAA